MTKQDLLPSIPRPPHDPKRWLLIERTNWFEEVLDRLEIVHDAEGTAAITLAVQEGSGRTLEESSGSFGGLTVPPNVAVGPGGDVYLLDLESLTLKIFDRCACRFDPVPCFGGRGAGPRELEEPKAIGIRRNDLYVCDAGEVVDVHGNVVRAPRVTVISLRGYVLRAVWYSPDSVEVTNTWAPHAIDFDSRGRAYVADPANGCVHRFDRSGCWEKCFGGLGLVTSLAVDCEDRIFARTDQVEPLVRVLDTDGEDLDVDARVESLRSHFPRLSFPVDTAGHLHLGELCYGDGDSGKVFDLSGNPVEPEPPLDTSYEPAGVFVSSALDSKLYQCQWHRVVIHGEIPEGTRVRVSTFSSETDQPLALINASDWSESCAASAVEGDEWDCLVRSPGGRFLRLRLELEGNTLATPAIVHVRVEFPRLSLRRFLPAVLGQDTVSADFTDRYLAIFDTVLRSIEWQIDHQARLLDPMSTPAEPDPATGLDFLTWLASWIGVTFSRQVPEARRRLLLKNAARNYPMRGTRLGLWRQLIEHLGIDPLTKRCCDDQPRTRCVPRPRNCAPEEDPPPAWQPPTLILEHFHLRRWLHVGSGRLGDQAVLWGRRIANRSQLLADDPAPEKEGFAQVGRTRLKTTQDPLRDPFHEYAHRFSVFVPACFGRSDSHRKALENLLDSSKPAHTQYQLEYVEPRFRIGFQSMIGFDSVIGRYPEGVTLNSTELGDDSVLGPSPHQQGGPSFQIGDSARIGTTTKLD